MTMPQMNKYKLVSWVLLVYFVFFIVPPVSTMAAFTQPAAGSPAGVTLEQDHKHAPLLLFDILLWQNLKKTKHSDEFVVLLRGDKGGLESRIDIAAIFPLGPDPARLEFAGSHSPLLQQSRSSSIRFYRSGVSPPSFSS
ncbi:MAG: hypothetical protein A2010_06165 [Nitrospirae bacterium GWD2_57_9]|nr:MAG: hypothetical protein A2010_06165 [Nitrospirae bacterium GWD2_57_9]OGW47145.1 MAG: hypothetical protein A2078_12430 [Nitrospirae bacterium GWC2_57_9]